MNVFATTYINMQDAYVVEALALGKWNQIGYTGPGSNSSSGSQTNVFIYKEAASAPQWSVTTRSKLNDCAANTANAWTLGAQLDTDATSKGQGNVKYYTGGNANCTGLTPSFDKLVEGRSTAD